MTSTITDLTVYEDAVRAATRAPSVHNTQPWRFVVAPPFVELFLDRGRVLAVADADGREARLSCGAALLNLRIAVRDAGRGVVADLLPDPTQPDLLARVRVTGTHPVPPELRALASAIERRTTNRRPFSDRAVSAPHRAALVRAARAEGADLVLLDRPQALEGFATLLRRADDLQESDLDFQTELLSWTMGRYSGIDGVPRTAGGPRPVRTSLLKLRDFPSPAGAEREFEQEPLVAVLGTPGDTPLDQLRAGQAMQRVLLAATAAGLSVSFLAQPIEVPHTRAAMRSLLDHRYPQTVLRIGYGHQAPPTPRRPVADVTTILA